MKYTIFIGYDIPESYDIKLELVLPIFDKQFERVELEGDIVHIVEGENSINFCEDIIAAFNSFYDIDLSPDIEELNEHSQKIIIRDE